MNKDLILIQNKLLNNTPFSLIRFGDGESNIIDNVPCDRNGFKFNPEDIRASHFRNKLIESLEYDGGDNYLLGINPTDLKLRAKSPVISANLFLNKNYLDFLKRVLPIFKTKSVYLICNKKASFKLLPFTPEVRFNIHNNAWEHDITEPLVENLETRLPKIILVAGGVYACTLIYNLFKKAPQHTYIDIGSILDPWLFKEFTRQYQIRILKYVIEGGNYEKMS